MISLDMAPIFVRAQNATLAYIAYIGKLFWPGGSPSSTPTTGIRQYYTSSCTRSVGHCFGSGHSDQTPQALRFHRLVVVPYNPRTGHRDRPGG
jgi:hypothetical protein